MDYDFGMRLINLINEKEITQKELSIELHIAPTTLNGYVNNYREPDFEILMRLATYFDVSTDYLLGMSSLRKPHPANLTNNEGVLIHIYRDLLPDKQALLIEQARLYRKFEQKRSAVKKEK